MAVGPCEAFVALAGEFASGLTPAFPVRPTDVGGDVAHPFRRVIGRHGHGAAIDHFAGRCPTVVLQVGAVLALVVLGALAEVVAGAVVALRSVLARVGLTVIDVQLAEVSREASGTQTLESIDFILTVTPVQTRVARTFIDVFLTVISCIARWTDTAITINQIPTGSIILTLAKAVINIYITILTRPTRNAVTIVAPDQVPTGIGIYTRFGLTFIRIYLTCFASPLRRTNTLKSIHQILTCSPMATVIWRTVINICGTRWPSPARKTPAFKSHGCFQTASSIVTGIRKTCVFRDFTVCSRIPLWAGTLIFVRTCVTTSTTIQTRLVSPTIVKIFVTKLTTPVGFTEALPRFNASAMDTSWVRNALITVLALPSILTPAFSWDLTGTMFRATSLTTNGSITFWSHPAFHAGFVAILVTSVVAEEVISGPAKLIAAEAVVMLITGDSDLILKVGHASVLLKSLPLSAGINHARVGGFLDNAVRVIGVIAVIPSFHEESVGSRPGETERENNPVSFAIPI